MIWWMLFLFFLLIGGYLVIRPMLAAQPQFREFYARANTLWEKAWVFAWNSATVLWSYLLAAFGFLSSQLDHFATLLGDPEFKSQISNVIGADTKTLGYVMMGIAFVTFAARMRSITQG